MALPVSSVPKTYIWVQAVRLQKFKLFNFLHFLVTMTNIRHSHPSLIWAESWAVVRSFETRHWYMPADSGWTLGSVRVSRDSVEEYRGWDAEFSLSMLSSTPSLYQTKWWIGDPDTRHRTEAPLPTSTTWLDGDTWTLNGTGGQK